MAVWQVVCTAKRLPERVFTFPALTKYQASEKAKQWLAAEGERGYSVASVRPAESA